MNKANACAGGGVLGRSCQPRSPPVATGHGHARGTRRKSSKCSKACGRARARGRSGHLRRAVPRWACWPVRETRNCAVRRSSTWTGPGAAPPGPCRTWPPACTMCRATRRRRGPTTSRPLKPRGQVAIRRACQLLRGAPLRRGRSTAPQPSGWSSYVFFDGVGANGVGSLRTVGRHGPCVAARPEGAGAVQEVGRRCAGWANWPVLGGPSGAQKSEDLQGPLRRGGKIVPATPSSLCLESPRPGGNWTLSDDEAKTGRGRSAQRGPGQADCGPGCLGSGHLPGSPG